MSENIKNFSKIKENNEKMTKNYKKNRKKTIKALAVATAVLGFTSVGFGIGYGIEKNNADTYKNNLENVYKNNFYSLVDSVNNLDNKLSKTINSSSSSYQRKTLLEASKNASEAETNISSLPLNQVDTYETTKMINQISGYTSTLAEKLLERDLNENEKSTLEEIEQSVKQLKLQLNELARKFNSEYSIIDTTKNNDTINNFSSNFSFYKNNVSYPSMIYDGPFSDSVTNKEVKGLNGEKISKEQGKINIEKYFKNTTEIEFVGETTGKFETFNYRVKNSMLETLYIQVSQIGGYILTISGAGENGINSIDEISAEKIALNFAEENGIENASVVWKDSIENDIYFNIAPTQNGIILYPDLVKVKINLTSGTIVGYDSTSYFSNHINRNLSKGNISYNQVSGKVPSQFELMQNRLVLAPLDYNREIMCIEIEARDNDDTYYFYFNDKNGELENVLKVIKTDNGNLLM